MILEFILNGGNPRCWINNTTRGGHGYLNVVGAIKNSCNYFFYEMGKRIGVDNIEKYAKFFGLGSKTGVELLGEVSRKRSFKGSEEIGIWAIH